MPISRVFLLCRYLLLLLLPAALLAQEVVVSGSAPVVGGDLALARWQAMNNALRSAAESGTVELRSTSLLNDGVAQESMSLRALLRSDGLRVLDERIEGGVLTVRVQTRLLAADAPADCSSPYRKRVLVAGMPLLRPEQLAMNEMQGYASGSALLFARRLEQAGRFAVAVEPATFIYESPAAAPRLFADTARQAMDRQRAQYLVSAVIRDLGLERVGAALFAPQLQRRIELEFFVHDRLSGEAVARRSFVRTAVGKVRLPGRTAFESVEFQESELGEAFAGIFAEAGRWVGEELACRPFHARVTAVRGRQLELDAGSGAGLRSGDLLILLSPGDSGMARPIASARIDELAPEGSVAEVPASLRPPTVGDLVMGW